mmetsp:Transcript_2122/g.4451  ORF Transcript_2122/g.4451 Transcript_2122/m.4451 type:complete len:148 (-) Transcript_2122:96-539(-)
MQSWESLSVSQNFYYFKFSCLNLLVSNRKVLVETFVSWSKNICLGLSNVGRKSLAPIQSHHLAPLPSPPWHFGEGATFEFLSHSEGVLAPPISREWNPRVPSDSDTAWLIARCRPTNRVPSKDSDTRTTLKWLSSDCWPCEVFFTSK